MMGLKLNHISKGAPGIPLTKINWDQGMDM